MSELLTTNQIKDRLKVDRITVYRMLNDGRLKGVKIGNQWRFPQSEIDRLMGEEKAIEQPENTDETLTDFPSDCVHMVQEIFAGIIGIGAMTITLEGDTLTNPTFSNPFCKLMLSNPTGRQACQTSWRKIALHSTRQPPFQMCHAGLSYQRAIVKLKDQPVAWLVAGQFFTNPPDLDQEKKRLIHLADKHNIPLSQLTEASTKIPVLKKYQTDQVQEWTPKVANTINSILCERADLMDRLQRIADLSNIRPTLSNNSTLIT
jgi:excisionase family DNA binding protein